MTCTTRRGGPRRGRGGRSRGERGERGFRCISWTAPLRNNFGEGHVAEQLKRSGQATALGTICPQLPL
eukprot:1478654-Pyramimonas_sp.AAC.1